MSSTSWASGSSGDWNTASNWTNGSPHSSSTALITASGVYTVTSSKENTVKILEISQGAILAINAGDVSVTEGTGQRALAGTIEIGNATSLVLGTFDQSQSGGNTTYKNTGTIAIQSGGSLKVKDAVQIDGGGRIIFSQFGRIGTYVEKNASGNMGSLGQLTNENTISGPGVIGAGDNSPYLMFINASNGVIDADGNTLLINVGDGGFQNDGLVQASTDSGVLSIIGQITNNGRIVSAASGAVIQLAGAQINGGTISIVEGATLLAQEDTNEINTTTTIANAGTIATDGGRLTIIGSVNNSTGTVVNSGSLAVSDLFKVTGEVTGGRATIYLSGELELEATSSVDVLFDGLSSGVLILNAPEKFTGTVYGFQFNQNVSIDLRDLPFHNPTVSAANGVLTVTDPSRTITINIGDGSTFIAKKAVNGSTLIFCTN